MAKIICASRLKDLLLLATRRAIDSKNEWPLRAMHTFTKLKTAKCQVFWGRLANLSQSGLINDLQVSLYHITNTGLFKYIENFNTKNWKFSDKNSNIFHISDQNIDCWNSLEPPRRGGSNEYLQSMFLNRNKKNNVYPCKPLFLLYKNGV